MDLTVTVKEAPQLENELRVYEDVALEFRARDISYLDRVKRRWPKETTGALVSQVDAGGWASVGGLRSDDLVLAVDGKTVRDVKELERELKPMKEKKPGEVVFFVRRRGADGLRGGAAHLGRAEGDVAMIAAGLVGVLTALLSLGSSGPRGRGAGHGRAERQGGGDGPPGAEAEDRRPGARAEGGGSGRGHRHHRADGRERLGVDPSGAFRRMLDAQRQQMQTSSPR